MRSHGRLLDATCVVVAVESLDVKTEDKAAPSSQAVAALKRSTWVILTNGRLWRLYSSRVSSSSTNYFEADLDGVAAETDARLVSRSLNKYLTRWKQLLDRDAISHKIY